MLLLLCSSLWEPKTLRCISLITPPLKTACMSGLRPATTRQLTMSYFLSKYIQQLVTELIHQKGANLSYSDKLRVFIIGDTRILLFKKLLKQLYIFVQIMFNKFFLHVSEITL